MKQVAPVSNEKSRYIKHRCADGSDKSKSLESTRRKSSQAQCSLPEWKLSVKQPEQQKWILL